ncbi:hypothetical protein DCAR_0831139 [Daucus carota subsp. sativus]|uniref:Uncharacterized protein n=1 Tax=Daucus carota subsp. sativus TaxID=79200 RepID=A0A175YKQ0_DAUCS|nr:PREDICTED: uncharacterized protein LOC108197686 [Daucus carota subsp. sativus]WOH11649.1 hypothetical protein DCAR_0831139 [Daucus carota subsp. sativus]
MGNLFNREATPLPIETTFKLQTQITTWSQGTDGFGSGTIDLGGLQVRQITTFNKVWATSQGGPDNLGATFYEPASVPDGFFMLGSYSQSNNKPLYGSVLVAKDITTAESGNAKILEKPVDYTLVWSNQGGNGYIWLPTPPEGYKALGHVVTSLSEKPSVDKIRCVRSDFTEVSETDAWIWGLKKEVDPSGFNVYGSKPATRGTQGVGVPVGTFIVQNNGTAALLGCLKNVQPDFSAMPNLDQIQTLMKNYSPLVYFHPDEEYLPSSLKWFFENGALLYTKGDESSPIPIEPPAGSNLPQGGSNDGAYWIGQPSNGSLRKGNLGSAESYVNVKPMFGGTFTDLAIWIFYPFNGAARASVAGVPIPLGQIGEHQGDWEHVTLRISNFSGELRSLYLSTHSNGTWASAPELEFQSSNKPVVYASLHGHALYAKPGLVLQGSGGIGLRNDTAKGKNVMDTGERFQVVSGEYLSIVEPAWVNYYREWGPRITYDLATEINKVQQSFPENLRSSFASFVKSLPAEILGQVGPTGPKMKSSWSGDEKV